MAITARQTGYRARFLLVGALAMVALGLGACSPESDRTQGGGAGADIGNRDEDVQLRGSQSAEERIYYQTPREAEYE